jgi:hypothetical protein
LAVAQQATHHGLDLSTEAWQTVAFQQDVILTRNLPQQVQNGHQETNALHRTPTPRWIFIFAFSTPPSRQSFIMLSMAESEPLRLGNEPIYCR